MKIKSVEIINVKGLGHSKFILDLIPNKPNLLVAPNGFGKSSFGIAFNSLKRNKIELNKKHYHNDKDTNRPILNLEVEDGLGVRILTADDTHNTINDEFDIFVINSLLMAKATKLKIGGTLIVKSDLEIEPIVLVSTIPPKVLFTYNSANSKRTFGSNGKILPNISNVFNCADLLNDIVNSIDLSKFSQVKLSKSITDLKTKINNQTGTTDQIKIWIETNKKTEIQVIPEFSNVSNILRQFDEIKSDVDSYLAAFQLIELFQNMGNDFKKAVNYISYLDDKTYYEQTISNFNSTRHTIKPKEDKKHNCLVVEFPKAHEISNGQRDVLSFITLLIKAKRNFKKQNCILVYSVPQF